MSEVSEKHYTIDGTMAGAHYNDRKVYLTDLFTGEKISETTVKDKKFSFTFPTNELRMYLLVYKYSDKDSFPITLPIVGGEGDVQVYMGGKVVTTGTPSNDALQDFLIARSNKADELLEAKIYGDELKSVFKKFLTGQIKLFKDSIVSIYIIRSFSKQFTDEEISHLLMQLNPAITALY